MNGASRKRAEGSGNRASREVSDHFEMLFGACRENGNVTVRATELGWPAIDGDALQRILFRQAELYMQLFWSAGSGEQDIRGNAFCACIRQPF